MTNIDLEVKQLIDSKNAKIQELEAKIEALSAEALALAQVAAEKGCLRELPESEAFRGVV